MTRGQRQLGNLVIALAVLLLSGHSASAEIGISAMGESTITTVLLGGAGSTWQSNYQTPGPTLAITGASGTWDVSVAQQNEDWHPDLKLSIQRDSLGIGGHPFTDFGPEVVLELPGQSYDFIKGGLGDLSNITTQIKLTGMSINVPAHTYTTKLVFTVTEVTP